MTVIKFIWLEILIHVFLYLDADPEMQEQIEKTFSIGHMSCEVLLSVCLLKYSFYCFCIF